MHKPLKMLQTLDGDFIMMRYAHDFIMALSVRTMPSATVTATSYVTITTAVTPNAITFYDESAYDRWVSIPSILSVRHREEWDRPLESRMMRQDQSRVSTKEILNIQYSTVYQYTAYKRGYHQIRV